ncbi:MAG: oxidoreductase-like domain-containing protein [Burkholderiales bacterium]
MKRRDDPPPVAPREPLPEECCGKGCTPCVLDTYAEALEKYRAALEAWKLREHARRSRPQARRASSKRSR